MPAYDFKPQFADAVANGTKTTTIRRRRASPTKVGDMLTLYTGMRTKACRQLNTVSVSAVTPIIISANGVTLGGRKLTSEEELRMAQRDGFVSVAEMIAFFGDLYGLPTEGLELIDWSVRSMDEALKAAEGIPEEVTPTLMIDLPTPESCLYCEARVDAFYYDCITYLVCTNNHAVVCEAIPAEAIFLHNLIASNFAEAKKSVALHTATIARQASIIEGLKRQLKKLSPPPATPIYHRLNTEDSE